MDSPPEVSAEVKGFLREKITSYEELEALLLLRRRPDESFSPQTVAEALHISETSAAEALAHLRRQGLLDVRVGGELPIFKYRPGSPHLARLVDQLAHAWDRNRLTVMNLMSSNAIERVRAEALRTFADAFLLGRKKPDD